jgi:hypothetical protein
MGCRERFIEDGQLVERDCYSGSPPTPPAGPGTELKALLAKFGIHATPTCKCNATAKQMDSMEPLEPGWCLSHIEEIVDVMQSTAKARGLPFLRAAGKLLVRRAVKNWQKKANSK